MPSSKGKQQVSKPGANAKLRLHFLGAARSVTGSLHFFEFTRAGKTTRFFLDMGLIQEDESLNFEHRLPKGLKAADIDFGIFSHAHRDHIGYFPRLVRDKFKGPAYATPATIALMELLLPDSGSVQESEHRACKRRYGACKEELLYGEADAIRALKQLKGVDFGRRFKPVPDIQVEFQPASHLLGAAVVSIEFGHGAQKVKVVFSGDIGRKGMPMLPDIACVKDADYVLCESTYGDRLHPVRDRLEILAGVINRAYGRASMAHRVHGNGVILIPAFAVGRSQAILHDLRTLIESKRIPNLPVFLDSPMAIRANEVYRKYGQFKRSGFRWFSRKKADPLSTPRYVECLEADRSAALDSPPSEPIIIVSASGMATGGRVLHHLKHRLPGAQNTVLFIGHQSHGTLGRQLKNGESDAVTIQGEEIKVRAAVEFLEDYSGHGDYNDILDWLSGFQKKPKKLFLVHGEEESATALKARIEKKLGWNVVVPSMRESVELG